MTTLCIHAYAVSFTFRVYKQVFNCGIHLHALQIGTSCNTSTEDNSVPDRHVSHRLAVTSYTGCLGPALPARLASLGPRFPAHMGHGFWPKMSFPGP